MRLKLLIALSILVLAGVSWLALAQPAPVTSTIRWTPPTHRVDGTALPASQILRYEITWNGREIARPAAGITTHRYTSACCILKTDTISIVAFDTAGNRSAPGTGHPDRDKCPVVAGDPVVPDPVVTVPPPTSPTTGPLPPQNFRVAVLSTSGTTINGRVQCDPMARVESVRLFVINLDGTLGNRLATYSACGGTYPKFVQGRSYVLKFVYRDGKLSDRSNKVTM
jgi:hypothetical protein